MAYSQAAKRAALKYRAAHLDQIAMSLPAGTRERWKTAAAAAGLSMQSYVKQAVEARIAADQAVASGDDTATTT